MCQNCSDGYFNPTPGGFCQAVSVCAIDQIESVPPTHTSDRVCGNCSLNSYAIGGRCLNVSSCPAGTQITTPATTSTDNVCTLCPAGTTDDDSNGNTPCVPCGPGNYTRPGSIGQCSNFMCSVGTVDSDSDASTPCVSCTGVVDFQSLPGMITCTSVTPCAAGAQQLRVSIIWS